MIHAMTPTYPAPLRPGDLIAVTAPSSGVAAPLHPRLDLVLAHLRSQGFRVEEGHCLRDERRDASAPADARANELSKLLQRDDVAAIIPPWGGELAVELLDRLDWPALAAARPKWLLGYSDTSTWLLPITLRLGWATAHCPCLMERVPAQNDLLTHATMPMLAAESGSLVEQHQSERWQAQQADWTLVPGAAFQLTEPTLWRCLNRAPDDAVQFGGRLIGGCLNTLAHIAGTAHGDVRAFIESCGADGAVLYLENAELSPTGFVHAMHRLRWSGWLQGLAGVLVGRSAAPDTTAAHQLRYHEALRSTLGELPCPVLVDMDIGHRPPQFTLINGALATVSWSTQHGGHMAQQLS
jgi:muramoyltetrapeptide carboxypeptidase